MRRLAYSRSGDADRHARRTRTADYRHRGEAVDELIFLVGDQIVEEQILVIENAVLGLQRHVHGKRQRLVRIGNDLHRPGVGAGQAEILLDYPVGDLEPDARLAAVESCRCSSSKACPSRY